MSLILIIAVGWLVVGLFVVGLCMAAAAGDVGLRLRGAGSKTPVPRGTRTAARRELVRRSAGIPRLP